MIELHYGGAKGFWDFLVEKRNDNCLMGCSIRSSGKSNLILDDDNNPTGLIACHSYSLTDVIELVDKKETIKLIRLRNPWGHTEWTGAWSGNS